MRNYDRESLTDILASAVPPYVLASLRLGGGRTSRVRVGAYQPPRPTESLNLTAKSVTCDRNHKIMRTLLDLIQEYAVLSEAKTLAGGILPPQDEQRWGELKRFYELLMAQQGLHPQPASRFTASDIRTTVTARQRLRVSTDLEIVVVHGETMARARIDNLSCGGVLLLCDSPLEKGGSLTLHLANISRGVGTMATNGEVVWLADRGSSGVSFRYKFGTRFLSLQEPEQQTLDSFVVDSLENKLLSLGRDSLDPAFLSREGITL